jgi:uncharacterized membrane protein
MTSYNFILFFHILSMAGLMIAVAFQWTMFRSAVSASDGDDTLRWIRATARLPLLVFPSLVIVLVTGIYMAARVNAFGQGWISATFLAILLIAAFSIMGGPATRALQKEAKHGNSDGIRRGLRRPLVVMHVRVQFALLLAITFLMVARTNLVTSLAIVGIGLVAGLLWSISAAHPGGIERGKR